MPDDATDAIDRNPFSADAMSSTARFLSTETERAAVAEQVDELGTDGFTHLPALLDRATLDRARLEIERVLEETPTSASAFGGYRTKRAFNLLGRSRAFDALASHPSVIATIEAHLADQIQLSEASTVVLGPGESSQILHHDDGCYPLPRPHPPLMVSVMWALDDFTVENGATRLAPGSHLDVDPDPGSLETVTLTMPAGSVGFWDGRTMHGAGANTTATARRGVAILYARAWLRQQENQYLCLDPRVVAGFDRRYQRLLGWSMYGPHTGIVGGRDPKHTLVDR